MTTIGKGKMGPSSPNGSPADIIFIISTQEVPDVNQFVHDFVTSLINDNKAHLKSPYRWAFDYYYKANDSKRCVAYAVARMHKYGEQLGLKFDVEKMGTHDFSCNYQGTTINGHYFLLFEHHDSNVDTISRNLKIIDYRSDKEKDMERRAKSSLDGEDEQLAQKLLMLIQRANADYSMNKEKFEKTRSEIREIGEYLCSNGGHDRMMQIAYRVETLGGKIRDLEYYWEYICGWLH